MDELNAVCRRLIDTGITPSLVLLAARGQDILLHQTFVRKESGAARSEASLDPIYDLASLTKPALTALALILLCQDGLIAPDQAVTDFIPAAHPQLRLYHLAAHCAGLIDWYPFYLFGDRFFERANELLAAAKPCRTVVYSCPGYILLRMIWQRLIEPETPQDWCRRRIFAPLGLRDTFFGGDIALLGSARVMPTETGSGFEQKLAKKQGFPLQTYDWPSETAHGLTHDLNARFLGGFGGNAGLFSTAVELLRLLNQCDPLTTSLLGDRPDLCAWFWKNLTPWSPAHRTFGFKRNSSLSAAAGRVLSRKAIGHHGFTGCTAWMEPQAGLRLIVLSNRIHPRVDESVNFNRIRRRLFRLMRRTVSSA